MRLNTRLIMSIFKDATKRIHASAVKWFTDGGARDINGRQRFAFMCVFTGIIVALVSLSAIADPLSDTVNNIESQVAVTSTTTIDLVRVVGDIINKYKLTNAEKCALLIIGTSATNSVPIYFVPGPKPISALQADINSSPLLVANVTIGPEGIKAGKTISRTANRFLVLGFNQTSLVPGTIAIAEFDTSWAGTGNYAISLTNFSASSPDGITVPICVTSGILTK